LPSGRSGVAKTDETGHLKTRMGTAMVKSSIGRAKSLSLQVMLSSMTVLDVALSMMSKMDSDVVQPASWVTNYATVLSQMYPS